MTPIDLQTLLIDTAIDVLHVIVVILIGKILIRVISATLIASISVAKGTDGFNERSERIRGVVRVIGNTILYGMVIVLVLEILGIQIGPILAGAGALGLIAGLGAQTLLKDFVSGIVISAEDQFRVGDRVKINSMVEGTVTGIALRLTTLRGDEGEIHHILNSSITTVTNYSRT